MISGKLSIFTPTIFFSNPIIMLVFCGFLSLLWPLFFSSKSYVHRVGIFLQFIFQIYLVISSIYEISKYGMSSYDLYAEHLSNNLLFTIQTSRIGIIFASLVVVLWPAAYFYSISYLESSGEGFESRFLFFLNLSICSALLLSIAGDIITLFICYEILTLSTIPLVSHHYTIHVNHVLKKYLLYLVGGSLCLWLPSILYLSHNDGVLFKLGGNIVIATLSARMQIIILVASIFGIAKAAIFPMHSWLPSAMAANYPTSAILHAVLVVNAGIYCIYKIIAEIFGLDLINRLFLESQWIQYILLFGVFYAGIMAVMQNTLKKILAWSTVAYLNLITLIALSGSKILFIISVLALITHSFSKISLFFCGGYIYIKNYSTKLKEFRGSAKKFRIIFLLFVIAIIPMKFIIYNSWCRNIIMQMENNILIFAMVISSTLSYMYFGKILIEMSLNRVNGDNNLISRSPTSSFMMIAIVYTVILAMVFLFYSHHIFGFLYSFLSAEL